MRPSSSSPTQSKVGSHWRALRGKEVARSNTNNNYYFCCVYNRQKQAWKEVGGQVKSCSENLEKEIGPGVCYIEGSEKRFYSLVGFFFFFLQEWGRMAYGILVPLLLELNQ